VTLDGSASTPLGAITTYTWAQVVGDSVGAIPQQAVAIVNPPVPGLYGFDLVVSDGTSDSLPDRVNVLVVDPAAPPPPEYTLTTATVGNGAVVVDPAPGPYIENTPVNVTADPAAGWGFSHWEGPVADPALAATVVIMTEDSDITAHFTELPPPPEGGAGWSGSDTVGVGYGNTGSGRVGDDGTFYGAANGPSGGALAEIAVTGAEPGGYFGFLASDDGMGPGDAPGDAGTFAGFAGGSALGRTFMAYTPLAPGTYVATISITFTADELAALGIEPADIELHVFNEDTNAWEPAGTNLGEAAPTGVVGDSGYVVNPDGSVTFWTVRDDLSEFAVGMPATAEPAPEPLPEPEPQPEPEPGAGQEQPEGETPVVISPLCSLCGIGCAQMGILSVLGLIAMGRVQRRREL